MSESAKAVAVARLVLEAESPLHIGSGRGDEVSDADVVTDMNGLPTIPGTSLAGVLRHQFAERFGEGPEQVVFGYQKEDKGEGSRVWVSFGLLHDAAGVPVEGLREGSDPVMEACRERILRHHVRIDARGVADAEGHGRFDERLVPAGARFTVELRVEAADDPEQVLVDVRKIVGGGLRLGGRTRRGLGSVRCVAWRERVFDLKDAGGWSDYLAYPTSLVAEAPQLAEVACEGEAAVDATAELTLRMRTPWGVGSGASEGEADIGLYRERRIVWEGGRGRVTEPQYVVPATSLKGVLAHRVAFHDLAQRGRFAEGAAAHEEVGEANPSVRELFGFVKGKEEQGQAGKVFLEDVVVGEVETDVILHNGLDRFTGGTRTGILFSERVLRRGVELKTRLQIRGGVDDVAKESLRRTLRDFRRGRLQLGHGYGRGNGWFEGEVVWSDGGVWIGEAQ